MRIEDITEERLKDAGLEELCAIYQFVRDPCEENWKWISMARLIDRRKHLLMFEWDKRTEWPPEFQPVDWLITLWESFFGEPMPMAYLEKHLELDIFPEMFMMREQLMTKEVPEEMWPSDLQGKDWSERLYLKHGLPIQKWPPPLPSRPQTPGIARIGQPVEYLEPRKPKPIERTTGDPFRSDKFGHILGDDDNEPNRGRGLGSR